MSRFMYALIGFLGVSVLGGTLIGASLYSTYAGRQERERQTGLTTGEIVQAKKKVVHSRNSRRTYWVPVVRYTANGIEYTLESATGKSLESEIEIGSTVDVCYDPLHPQCFRLPDHDEAGEKAEREVFNIGIGVEVLALLVAVYLYFQ